MAMTMIGVPRQILRSTGLTAKRMTSCLQIGSVMTLQTFQDARMMEETVVYHIQKNTHQSVPIALANWTLTKLT